MTTEDDRHVKEVAGRIKKARFLTGLQQNEFAAKHNFSINTLQSLELGRLKLSPKVADRFCAILKAEGILCTPEWLAHGEGLHPRHESVLPYSPEQYGQLSQEASEEAIIREEILTFQKWNREAIVTQIQDDALAPLYRSGDYVGGKRLRSSQMDRLLGHSCIVEVEPALFLARHFSKSNDGSTYVLSALNPQTTVATPLLYVKKPLSAAFILWHRRLHP